MGRHTHLSPLVLLLLAGLTLAWGSNWSLMKLSLQEIPLWQYRAITMVGAGLATLGLAVLNGGRLLPPRQEWPLIAVAGIFNIACWHVFSAYGLLHAPTGMVSMIAYTMPVWSSVLAVWFLREALTMRRVMALIMGIGGIVVLFLRGPVELEGSILGGGFALLAAFSWAIGTIVIKRVTWSIPTLSLIAWQVLIGAVPVTAIALATEPFVAHRASFEALAATAYTIFVALVFGYYAWFKIVSLIPAGVAAISTLIIPVVALVSGALAWGEPLGWRELLSAGLIVGALALVLLQRTPAPQPET